MVFQVAGLLACAIVFKQVPEPLCPCDRGALCYRYQSLGINLLHKFMQDGRDLIKPSHAPAIADKIQRGRLWRRDADDTARCVDVLEGDLLQVLSDDERHAYLPTGKGSSRLFKEYLEFLWPVMGCTMKLCSGQESRVVGLVELLHQCRDELIRRQAPQRTVFRRNDHIEAPRGLCDHILPDEPVEGLLGGIRRYAQRSTRLT